MRVIVSLRDLLLEQIGYLYSAEIQQMKALRLLSDKASACTLKETIRRHAMETAEHVTRLDRVLGSMQEKTEGAENKCMQCLIEHAITLCERCVSTTVMDAAIITAIQHLNHYEVAGYGAACAFANELNAHEIASLLHESLEEVKSTDKFLADLAKGAINVNANATTIEAVETNGILGVNFEAY